MVMPTAFFSQSRAARTPSELARCSLPILLFGCVLASPAVAQGAAADVVTPEDIVNTFDERAATDSLNPALVSWCPKSACVLAAVQRGGETHVILAGADGRSQRDLGPGLLGKLSPDGRMAALITPQFRLKVIALRDRGSRALVDIPLNSVRPVDSMTRMNPEVSFAWSPDSRWLTFSTIRDADRSQYPSDTRGVTVQAADLMLLDTITGGRTRLFTGSGSILDVQWSGRGSEVTFIHAPDLPWGTPARLTTLTVRTHQVRTLRVFDRPYASYDLARPALSGDGRYITFTADRFGQPPSIVDLSHFVMDRRDGTIQMIPQSHRISYVGRPAWDRFRGAFIFACRDGVFVDAICRYAPGAEHMSVHPLGNPLEAVTAWDLSPDGRQVAVQTQDVFGNARLRICGDARCRTIVLSLSSLSSRRMGQATVIRWRAHDGLQDVGLLIRPAVRTGDAPPPLIVDIHGGPSGGVYPKGSLAFNSPLEWQMWAGMGFAVLVPEYRQSGRLGEDPAHLRRAPGRPWLEGSVDDILSGVDEAVRLDAADPSRLAILGVSWGAVVVNTLITHTDRFKVAISKEGVSDEVAFNAEHPEQAETVSWMFNTTRDNLRSVLFENSPVNHAGAIRTPLLSIRGGESPVGVSTAQAFADAIRSNGVDAEVLAIAGEGHGFSRRDSIRRVICESTVFVRKYIPSAGTSETAAPCR